MKKEDLINEKSKIKPMKRAVKAGLGCFIGGVLSLYGVSVLITNIPIGLLLIAIATFFVWYGFKG